MYEDCAHPDQPSRRDDRLKYLEGYILSDVAKAISFQKSDISFASRRKKAARRRLFDSSGEMIRYCEAAVPVVAVPVSAAGAVLATVSFWAKYS